MKTKIILLAVFSLFSIGISAQEVRGIETKRAIYEGDSYKLVYSECGRNTYYYTLGNSTEYIGFEFYNLNSISVSVTIEVYAKDIKEDKLIDTKDIVLKSKERYIHKYPSLQRFYSERWAEGGYVVSNCGDVRKSKTEMWKELQDYGETIANRYYVKYKAFKLL